MGSMRSACKAEPLDSAKRARRLAFALFREAGVPAPRTAMAEVTLTVPGRHDKAYLGLYTLVESVDQVFLKDRFHSDKGLLLKPQGLRGLDFLGDDWEKYRPGHIGRWPWSQARTRPNASSNSSDWSSRVTMRSSATRSSRTLISTSSCGSWPSRR